jgi:hypothetical protein
LISHSLPRAHHVEHQGQGDFQSESPLSGKKAEVEQGFNGVSVRQELLEKFRQEKMAAASFSAAFGTILSRLDHVISFYFNKLRMIIAWIFP